MLQLKFNRSTIVCLVTGLFLVGLVLAQRLTVPLWLVGLIAAATVAGWRWRYRNWLLLAAALVIGIARGNAAVAAQHRLETQFGQKVTVVGTVRDDPYLDAKNHTHFTIGSATIDGRPTGDIGVLTYQVRLTRGYQVAVSGKLESTLGAASAAIGFGQVQTLSTHLGWMERLRQRFFAGMRTALPEPLASFGLGLLIGVRALIPQNLQTELAVVGLSHLIAVSGYNLTILINAVGRLLGRRFKFGRLAACLWLIAGFVVLSGASASIVRAAIVSTLTLWAAYYGRSIKPLVLVLVAAATTAGFSPSYLYRDVGWQLSFLAFAGILVVAPLVLRGSKSFLVGILTESLMAFIVTAPLIAYVFGTFSLVAPLANLIILPLVPAAMLFSFLAGLGGMVIPLVVGYVALPAILLMRLMLGVIDWLDHVRLASLTLHVSLAQYVALDVVMALAVTALLLRRRSDGPGGIILTKEPDHVRTQQVA